jgi:serine/threonine protein kinase
MQVSLHHHAFALKLLFNTDPDESALTTRTIISKAKVRVICEHCGGLQLAFRSCVVCRRRTTFCVAFCVCLSLAQNEQQLLERELRDNRHRNILQLHRALTSRPYDRLRDVAVAAVDDLRRVQWGARAVFLVTDFVPWTLRDALRMRRAAREAAAEGRTGRNTQHEEYGWTIAVISDVAEAVLHLWRLNILHMDISTKNITIAPYGHCACGVTGNRSRPHAVLIDFGSAIHVTVPGSLRGCTGNLPHLAPEVLIAIADQRRNTTALTFDLRYQPVFELGVLAYEVALGGAHPLPGYPDTVDGWTDGDMPALPDEFPSDFVALVVSCVRFAAEERPQLQDVVASLRRLRVEEGIAPGYSLPPRSPWVRADSQAMEEASARCVVKAVAAAETPVASGAHRAMA